MTNYLYKGQTWRNSNWKQRKHTNYILQKNANVKWHINSIDGKLEEIQIENI